MQAVAVPAKIDVDNAAQVLAGLREATRKAEPGPLALDLSPLREFDSSALSLLLQLAREREARDAGAGNVVRPMPEGAGAARTGAAKPTAVALFLLDPPEKLRELADLYGVAAMLFGPDERNQGQERQG